MPPLKLRDKADFRRRSDWVAIRQNRRSRTASGVSGSGGIGTLFVAAKHSSAEQKHKINCYLSANRYPEAALIAHANARIENHHGWKADAADTW